MRRLFAIAVMAASACAHRPAGVVRFKNEEPVARVDDRKNIAEPEAYEETLTPYYMDVFAVRRFTRWTELREHHRAQNVNALDEVPDSTWFTNRIGVREVSTEELLAGPGDGTTPQKSKPFIVSRMKVGGKSVGFVAKDSAGHKFLLKFDTKGFPEIETGADVVGQRLFWALGFNVPDDEVVTFKRDELTIAPDAKNRDAFGKDIPLTDKDVDKNLKLVDIAEDGTIRGLTSGFIPGKILGGFTVEGTRSDDPNDTVAHQNRREVRGSLLFYAWIGDIDTKKMNTLDVWQTDRSDENIRYIRHYFVDFGKSFGAWREELKLPYDGYAATLDWGQMGKSLITAGFWPRPWEKVIYPGLRGVGWFERTTFDPDDFRGAYPYYPHTQMDWSDAFWAAKLIMRFSTDQIRAAVEAGRYSDPKSSAYLVRTLVERQRKIGQVWFRRVAPLDGIRLSADTKSICFDDLLNRYDFATGDTTYIATAYDYNGEPTGWRAEAHRGKHSDIVCMKQFVMAKTDYTIVELKVQRASAIDGPDLKPVLVHVATSPDGVPRVIGIWREH